MRPSDLPERFAAKIEVAPNGCWLWTGARHGEGYGNYWHEGAIVLAHRFAYERLVSEIPVGLTLDHVRERGCTSRLCVNPAHLEPVSYGENNARGEHPNFVAHRERRCTRGHPAEFYRRPSGPRKGQTVYCLACKREEITEKEWDAQLFNSQKGLAPSLGWKLSYHTLRSKGSQPGFPDRTCIRERLLFAELKTEKGKPTERQVVWLDALAKAGAEVYLWRPSDLEEIGRILSGHWRFMCYRHAESVGEVQPPHLATISGPWSPASIWFPGQGRWGDTPWA